MTWDTFLAIAIIALASASVVYKFTKKSKSKCGGNCGCGQSQGSQASQGAPLHQGTDRPLPMDDKACGQCIVQK